MLLVFIRNLFNKQVVNNEYYEMVIKYLNE